GEEGAGDHRVQAYNFRMCLTDDPANRAVVTKPDGYDPLQYETVLRHLLAHPQARLGEILFTLVPMPNRKTDSNNKNLFSTDFVGASHAWPEASYEERARIWQAHRTYQQGLLWFLANDPRVPETLRAEVAEWGLARDEFADNGNWPYQLYVREARRMVADYVVTEHDTVGRHRAPDPVALASYGMDSHLVSLFVDDQHRLRLEGAFFKSVKPYPVSYRAVVPKKSECTNLLVPVCVSASHAAYGSMRMEPVFMMLGQAAATAAALAVQSPSAVQDVPYESLRDHLRRDGMVLDAPAPAEKPSASPAALEKADPDSPAAAAIENLAARGVLADKEYWLMNVKPKATCDGEMVGVVLIKSASLFEPVDNLDAAIDVLIKNSVITAPEYWQERARAGKVCHGVQVGNIFQALAKRLPQ
ncbi:MAG TPA: FAD-dependent oxidoreductase, partial [Terrimicrobiaceae bacterium]|nr:FAD-dependent oxidoreductase [Terrimicrobiaceae bacterium]